MKFSCTSVSNSFGRVAITVDSKFVAFARNSTSVEINANPRLSTNVEMSAFLDSMSVKYEKQFLLLLCFEMSLV